MDEHRVRNAKTARDDTALTYLYCLVRCRKAPLVGKAPRGLPGMGRVRAVAVRETLWLIVADAPRERYDAAAIESGLRDLGWVSACGMAHEAVIEHFARAAAGAVIPMKLFTIFSTEARALEHISRDIRRLERLLDRLAGRQEWGVRIALDEARAMTRARERARRAVGPVGSGASFLRLKKEERDLRRRLFQDARAEIDPVFEELARHADDARRRPPSAAEAAARLLLDAAFLVPSKNAAKFRTAASRIAAHLDPEGCALTLTGPWPPYNFVSGMA
jgi:hypothetical protein